MLARQAILAGDASVVVAGGQESMSQSVHACAMREGTKFGGKELVDTMLLDGLTDAFENYHMGITGWIFKLYLCSNEDKSSCIFSPQPRTLPSAGT